MKNYNIDPELMPVIEMLPDFGFEDPAAAREGMEDLIAMLNSELDESGVLLENIKIPAPEYAPDIALRIYRPESLQTGQKTAGLLYIHGGGFAVGNLDTEHGSALALCRDLGVVVVSVDYRLAPEDPYPAALEDCYSALCWMADSSDLLQVDSQRIAVCGQSAGGGLSASLALLAKERGGPSICFQFLGIPELDDRLQTNSMKEFDDTPMWHRGNAILSWQFYLRNVYKPGSASVPITAAPARASLEQLRDLPPACVTTMEFDPLRDEGIEYALQLLRAGVSVELHSYPGTFHGSSMVPNAQISRREQDDMRAVLRRALNLQETSHE